MYVTLTIDKKIHTHNKVVNTRACMAQNHFATSAGWSISITHKSFIKFLKLEFVHSNVVIYKSVSQILLKFGVFLIAADYVASYYNFHCGCYPCKFPNIVEERFQQKP